jgi:hypothetical protein
MMTLLGAVKILLIEFPFMGEKGRGGEIRQ